MPTYNHHITGRMRTRYPQLKNNPARARGVEVAIRKIDGVISVEASTITGSLLVHYDAHETRRTAVLETLFRTKQKLGLKQGPYPRKRNDHAGMPVLAEPVVDKVLGMIVEKCIERSAFALLAALL
jgi:hypothetical protein